MLWTSNNRYVTLVEVEDFLGEFSGGFLSRVCRVGKSNIDGCGFWALRYPVGSWNTRSGVSGAFLAVLNIDLVGLFALGRQTGAGRLGLNCMLLGYLCSKF